jgi:hypothetical protein
MSKIISFTIIFLVMSLFINTDVLFSVSAVYAETTSGENGVEFTEKPRLIKEGNNWYITFATRTKCDVTVSIVNKNGKIIRHLASGIVGQNAPSPFQQTALKQKLVWDGKDDHGKTLSPEGCKVQISLGLTPRFIRMLCSAVDGVATRGPVGLAVDRDGNLYVTEGDLWVFPPGVAGVIQVLSIKAFDRDGNYLRTLVPFRADWPQERISEVEFLVTKDGRRIPLSGPSGHRPYCGFIRGSPGTTRHIPVITSDGRLIFPCGKEAISGARRFISVGIDGSVPKTLFEGPPFPPNSVSAGNIFAVLSPDEKYLYFAGVRFKRESTTVPSHAIYRVELNSTEPAKTFIGKEFESGNGEYEFNEPRGIDVDSQGRLFVGDYFNDRIQVFSSEGKFIKSLPVTGPEQIRINRKTGAIYVLSVKDRGQRQSYTKSISWEIYEDKSVVKYASINDWRIIAELNLPKRAKHMHDAGPIMVLDSYANEPILWIANVGRQEVEDILWKVIDRGDKLEKVEHKVPRLNRHAHVSPQLAGDRENNELYAFGTPEGHVKINPSTGEVTKLVFTDEHGKEFSPGIVGSASVGSDGMLYIRSARMLDKNERMWELRRFNRQGNLVPFKNQIPFIDTNGKQAVTPFNEQATPFAVGPDGKIYIVEAISRETKDVRMNLYNQDGELIKTNFISMTRSGGCVRINVQGQLYVADTVRPKDLQFPDFLPSDPRKHFAKWYGTLFRYNPEGGGIVPVSDIQQATHMAGGKDLPLTPVVVKGILWGFYGISPMPLQTGCQCLMADFDVDDWGRVWVPDACGYCVTVLDSAGNIITRFGAYGNRDARGAGSSIPEPPIPLWSPERVGALDKDVFVADGLNCRIVQVHLDYSVTEELPLQ